MVITNIAKDSFKLLKKDLILLKWRVIIVCLMIAPFFLISLILFKDPDFDRSSFGAIFLMNFVYILVILLFESKAKNQKLLPSLPSTRNKIVTSRYLGICVFYLATLVFYFLVSLLINFSGLPIKLSWIKHDTILSSGLSVIFLVSISMFLQFSIRNISALFITIYFLPYTIIYMSKDQFFSVLIWTLTHRDSQDGSVNIYIGVFLLLFLMLSYLLSLWVYRKREFV